MITKWMRLGRGPRLCVVAVAIAAGGSLVARGGCEPGSVHGPDPPCHSNEDCEREVGPGSRCEGDIWYDDGCGGRIHWGGVCSYVPPAGDADADADGLADAATDGADDSGEGDSGGAE